MVYTASLVAFLQTLLQSFQVSKFEVGLGGGGISEGQPAKPVLRFRGEERSR